MARANGKIKKSNKYFSFSSSAESFDNFSVFQPFRKLLSALNCNGSYNKLLSALTRPTRCQQQLVLTEQLTKQSKDWTLVGKKKEYTKIKDRRRIFHCVKYTTIKLPPWWNMFALGPKPHTLCQLVHYSTCALLNYSKLVFSETSKMLYTSRCKIVTKNFMTDK